MAAVLFALLLLLATRPKIYRMDSQIRGVVEFRDCNMLCIVVKGTKCMCPDDRYFMSLYGIS
jgi:hypothetical protein